MVYQLSGQKTFQRNERIIKVVSRPVIYIYIYSFVSILNSEKGKSRLKCKFVIYSDSMMDVKQSGSYLYCSRNSADLMNEITRITLNRTKN